MFARGLLAGEMPAYFAAQHVVQCHRYPGRRLQNVCYGKCVYKGIRIDGLQLKSVHCSGGRGGYAFSSRKLENVLGGELLQGGKQIDIATFRERRARGQTKA